MPALNRAWLKAAGYSDADAASYLVGDTGLLLLGYALSPNAETAARLETLIAGNLDHPSRELMWGAPGTMLPALFLHQRTDEPRWAALYVATTRKLWSQLLRSPEFQCSYWTQDLDGRESTFLDAVHGFVGTARGRVPDAGHVLPRRPSRRGTRSLTPPLPIQCFCTHRTTPRSDP